MYSRIYVNVLPGVCYRILFYIHNYLFNMMHYMKANTHFKLITLLERNEHLLSRGKKNHILKKINRY